jgi:hypothetical protein
MKGLLSLCLVMGILVATPLWLGGCASSHKKPADSQSAYRCEVCGSEFISEAEWKDHMEQNHPEK